MFLQFPFPENGLTLFRDRAPLGVPLFDIVKAVWCVNVPFSFRRRRTLQPLEAWCLELAPGTTLPPLSAWSPI
jgi:hypothetical protein